jgi:hypothetical protein
VGEDVSGMAHAAKSRRTRSIMGTEKGHCRSSSFLRRFREKIEENKSLRYIHSENKEFEPDQQHDILDKGNIPDITLAVN